MVDYTKATGSGGVMIIRDNGSNVEFLIQAGFTSSFSTFTWSGRVNGADVGGTVSYPTGRPTLSLGSWGVSSTQDVTFRIPDTGTSGLGGPTEFTQSILRGPPPEAPSGLTVEVQTPTRIGIRYTRGSDNGSPIVQDEARWYRMNSDGSFAELVWVNDDLNGYTDPQDGVYGPVLTPATKYAIVIRSRNAVGWGAEARIDVYTAGGGSIKIDGVYRKAIPYVKIDGVYRLAMSYVKVDGSYRPTG